MQELTCWIASVHLCSMLTEDDYIRMLGKLDEELSGESPEGKMRAIARSEAEGVTAKYVALIAFLALCAWLPGKIGLPDWAVVVGLFAAIIGWIVVRAERNPEEGRHLVVPQAEDLARLAIVQEIFAAGGQCWEVKPNVDDPDKLTVYPMKDEGWGNFHERAYDAAVELRSLSPKQRRQKLVDARHAAAQALAAGRGLAEKSGATMVFWADR